MNGVYLGLLWAASESVHLLVGVSSPLPAPCRSPKPRDTTVYDRSYICLLFYDLRHAFEIQKWHISVPITPAEYGRSALTELTRRTATDEVIELELSFC